MLVIAILTAIVIGVVIACVQPQMPETFSRGFQQVRTMFGGVQGRAVGGIAPPSLADRHAAIIAAASSQNVVTRAQEVVMTGERSHNCLGADNEVMLEVENDIGAHQIDVSYSFEGASGQMSGRPIKVASCGAQSMIKQCIPVATATQKMRLQALAYYYEEPVDGKSNIREEPRVYPTLVDKVDDKIILKASEFLVAV
jgi:hypothetical protein